MRPLHIFYAVLIAFAWGMNAPIVKMAVQDVPAAVFATVRCAFLALLVPFFRRPNVAWGTIWSFTALHGVKISFLYYSLVFGIGAGISTVLLQTQSLFTVFLAVLIFKELVTLVSAAGLFLAFGGVCFIGFTMYAQGSFVAMIFVILSALLASFSYLLLRNHQRVNYMSFIGYFNLFSVLPFLLLSYILVGGEGILASLPHMMNMRFAFLVFLSGLTVIVAYGYMMKLLKIYPTSQVAPYLLLMPVFGLLGGAVCLDEWCGFNEYFGSAIVICGLALNQYGARRHARKTSA